MKTKELIIALIALIIGVALGWLIATQQAMPEKLEETNDDNTVSQNITSDYLAAQILDEGPTSPTQTVTGTHFDLGDGVLLDTSETVTMSFSTKHAKIMMKISEADTGTVNFTLSGLEPSSTYDALATGQSESFTADASGQYTLTVDLAATKHLMITQGKPTAQSASQGLQIKADGGDCNGIGVWNASTKVCTLNTDVTDTINIYDPGTQLNCAGHKIAIPYNWFGIYVYAEQVTINNCDVEAYYGITSDYPELTVKNSNIVSTRVGIWPWTASSTTIIGNTITARTAISVYESDNLLIKGNTFEASIGISLSGRFHTIENNQFNYNPTWEYYMWGISTSDLSDSTVRNNVFTYTECPASATQCIGRAVGMDFYPYLTESSRNLIKNNQFIGSEGNTKGRVENGLELLNWWSSELTGENMILGNTFSNMQGTGIRFSTQAWGNPSPGGVVGTVASDNTLQNVGVVGGAAIEIETMGWDGYIGTFLDNQITNNLITNSPGSGIRVHSGKWGGSDNIVKGNSIDNNKITGSQENGVLLLNEGGDVSDNDVTRNVISSNTLNGVELVGGAAANYNIYQNDIFANDGYGVSSDVARELSVGGIGNWWHGNCVKGLFIEGVDTTVGVMDSYPFIHAVAHIPDPNDPKSCPEH